VVVSVSLALVGLVVLVLAGDQLVVGSARVAASMRVPPVVIGVVLIGWGTSAPELLVSGIAAGRGDFGLAIGNLVGSNVVNLTLVLGVAGMLAPVTIRSAILRREAPMAVAAVAAFALVLLLGLNRVTGAVLAVLLAVALVALLRPTRAAGPDPAVKEVAEGVADGVGEVTAGSTALQVTRAVLGLVGTLAGAALVVDNAVDVATRLQVPQAFIGFSVVALGTSLPELVAAVQAQRHGEVDLLVGNLFGSNLFNSLAGGATVGLVGGTATGDTGIHAVAVGLMVATSLLAWLLLSRGSRLVRAEAAVLLAGYALVIPLLLP
jgi:cation:H+ antiporter